jgi:hypothetical protein
MLFYYSPVVSESSLHLRLSRQLTKSLCCYRSSWVTAQKLSLKLTHTICVILQSPMDFHPVFSHFYINRSLSRVYLNSPFRLSTLFSFNLANLHYCQQYHQTLRTTHHLRTAKMNSNSDNSAATKTELQQLRDEIMQKLIELSLASPPPTTSQLPTPKKVEYETTPSKSAGFKFTEPHTNSSTKP